MTTGWDGSGRFEARYATWVAENQYEPDSEQGRFWLEHGREVDALAEAGVRPHLSEEAVTALERGDRSPSSEEFALLNQADEAGVLTAREETVYLDAVERTGYDPFRAPVGGREWAGGAEEAESELVGAPVNLDTVDAIVRANAGDDGISASEDAAIVGALDAESRNQARSLRAAAADRLRGTAGRLERLADRLEGSAAASETTATQRAAHLYQDGRDRYDEQHHSPAVG